MRSNDRESLPALHELESEVMEEMWRRGSATVREVLHALNERSEKQRAYTTIMTILARLERKGVLERHKEGKGFVYTPRASREEYLECRAKTEVEALVDEFGDVALVHFARAKRLRALVVDQEDKAVHVERL